MGKGHIVTAGLPRIDAAWALDRITSLSGQDEVISPRACLEFRATFAERPEDHRSSQSGLPTCLEQVAVTSLTDLPDPRAPLPRTPLTLPIAVSSS